MMKSKTFIEKLIDAAQKQNPVRHGLFRRAHDGRE